MRYLANQLFKISMVEDAVFPLNLRFNISKSTDDTFNQSGIFFMTYKSELIYIGYADCQEALDRMSRQLETITLRGSKVAFNETSTQTIKNSTCLNSHFTDSMLERKNGFETSKKRIVFAENHWKDFTFLDDCLLKNFAFDWYPIEMGIDQKCQELKEKLKPRCNQEGILPGDYALLIKK